jgi:hypothetical protein
MPSIGELTIIEFKERINRFEMKYTIDWEIWRETHPEDMVSQFGSILRKWQACRPNVMRRTRGDQKHTPPYLEDLIGMANLFLPALDSFDISKGRSFSPDSMHSFRELWRIFQYLPYHGKAHNGLSSVTGISKAVMLLTNGKVGPAFDSTVRGNLGLKNMSSPEQWIRALQMVNDDIMQFERSNGISIIQAAPEAFRHLQPGRIYDMVLGPGT